ncbi:MAG: tautomerase family protein [Clostridia bacterium]|nr:tautomerase family protein [Clostridia bacterium]
MPYIRIKAYPKDEAVKQRVAERVRDVFLEEWGCPLEAISLSFEEVAPAEWENTVQKPEIDARPEIMMIHNGKKNF